MSERGSHLGMMAAIAQLGFPAAPSRMKHRDKGHGTLMMDGEGLRFYPDNGNEPLVITWQDFWA